MEPLTSKTVIHAGRTSLLPGCKATIVFVVVRTRYNSRVPLGYALLFRHSLSPLGDRRTRLDYFAVSLASIIRAGMSPERDKGGARGNTRERFAEGALYATHPIVRHVYDDFRPLDQQRPREMLAVSASSAASSRLPSLSVLLETTTGKNNAVARFNLHDGARARASIIRVCRVAAGRLPSNVGSITS